MSEETGSLVLSSEGDGLCWLTLNRPASLNALSPQLFVELRAHLESLASRIDEIGCVILSGAGRSFSAGNDLKAIQNGEKAPTPTFQAETLELMESLPQPIIAAVRGHCYTGALELALACDLLVASQDARFCDTHGKWALTPTWGMTQRLPRRIGPLRARELMFTGRVVTGEEAVELGLANRCVAGEELEAESEAMARRILDSSWHTVRWDKKLINEGQNFALREGLDFERRTSPGPGPDMVERLAAFARKSE